MTGVLSALAPVFGLIAVGYLLKSRRIFTDDFWDPAERLTFYFLFPALLITSIGGAEAGGPDLLPMATALVGATGLMAVGAGLDFTAVREARNAVIGTAVLKLAVTPAVTYAACQVFGVTGPAAAVAVMFMALPVSAASYVMSRQLGGDGSLMAGIVTATTLGAAVTLPLAGVLAG